MGSGKENDVCILILLSFYMVSVGEGRGGRLQERGEWRSGWQETERKQTFPYCSLPFLHDAHNQH